VCVLRYKRHAYMSSSQGGIAGFAITKELSKHAAQEQIHADRLAERIVQLGGEPDFDPVSIAKRSHNPYVAGTTLREMITESLVAERVAVEAYSKLIRYIGEKDATTRRLLEEILEQEEEHADELSDFGARLKMSGDNSK
jgi:bacterioferritin